MSEEILSISNLHKHFGRIKAVDGLDLNVKRGEVLGILGPNGSGKTTTLGIILSVIKADNGSFTWFGNTPDPSSLRRIGAILERPLFYPYLDAIDNLKIIADIRKIPYQTIDLALKQVDLYNRRKSKFRTFSLGMKQRLAVAAALLGKPEVLILDEPTNGLDPQGIAEIRELIIKISAQGVTIILASHLLDEVQKTCTHVVVLNNGKKIDSGKINELTLNQLTVDIQADDMQALEHIIINWEGTLSYIKQEDKLSIKLKSGFTSAHLNQAVFDAKITLNHLASSQNNLEKHFLELLSQPS